MPIDLNIVWMSPPCRAVWLACMAGQIDINVNLVDVRNGANKKDEFLKMNHFGLVPVINDEGFYLNESRSIMRYLMDKHSKVVTLYPKDVRQRALVDRVLDYDCGTTFPTVHNYTYPQVFEDKNADPALTVILLRVLQLLETSPTFWEDTYLTGPNVTIGDFSLATSLSFLEVVNFDFSEFPKLKAWRERMRTLPYYSHVHEGFEERKAAIQERMARRKSQ